MARPDGDGPSISAGVVGLGLIGGSFARAWRAAGAEVLAWDPDRDAMAAASVEVVSGELDDEAIAGLDAIVLATYPDASIEWLERHAPAIAAASDPASGTGPLVMDTAGVKASVCERAFDLAARHGFAFVGTHPMAGTEHSGFAWSRADLFQGAPMVLVPPPMGDMERLMLLDRTHDLLAPLGFGSFSVATPAEHDEVIAFTSQLAHVVSNAYVKSPTARVHHGFSAGSYRDLTRVAHLNAPMWAELMVDDADNLSREITHLIDELARYRDALDARDRDRMEELLAEGDRIKRSLDDGRR